MHMCRRANRREKGDKWAALSRVGIRLGTGDGGGGRMGSETQRTGRSNRYFLSCCTFVIVFLVQILQIQREFNDLVSLVSSCRIIIFGHHVCVIPRVEMRGGNGQ